MGLRYYDSVTGCYRVKNRFYYAAVGFLLGTALGLILSFAM